MTVRRATVDDVDALLALWAAARTTHAVTPDTREGILGALARSAIFVVDALNPSNLHGSAGLDGFDLAGAVVAGWDGWRGNLYRLAVAASARRGGVGSALVAAGEAWLIEQGAQRMSILVGFEDAEARRFWSSVGYEADAVIGRMIRDLDSTE